MFLDSFTFYKSVFPGMSCGKHVRPSVLCELTNFHLFVILYVELRRFIAYNESNLRFLPSWWLFDFFPTKKIIKTLFISSISGDYKLFSVVLFCPQSTQLDMDKPTLPPPPQTSPSCKLTLALCDLYPTPSFFHQHSHGDIDTRAVMG